MIKAALAWFSGVNVLPWGIGAAVLIIAGLTALWRIEAGQRDAAELRLTAVQEHLATAQAAIADRDAVMAAMDRQAQAVRALQDEIEPTRRVIYAAPRSTECVASPVVRAGLDSMRAARAARAAAARTGARAGPADLPAAPGGAVDRTGR
ncbi:hypothetical protein KPL78_29655 [Roseomonas sp. HJA6]|uniref:DUF2570 domain-containing protein n=1 Tax=Roseomonas alba TaxID=2846776 RepID=A0ABS7ALN5_9PROT|nr:hypothetical protein [Neoroseomonas alba]MBW6402049.1 hypothetical protein [Neoroseomonas alba]